MSAQDPLADHVHVIFALDDGFELRFRDPRRFGLIEATDALELEEHPLFQHLGVEPLDDAFDAEFAHRVSRGRRRPLKTFIMDARIVVGVGNIYASEVLFRARLHPFRAAGRTSRATMERLVAAIKTVLSEALRDGGTTIEDFRDGSGRKGGHQNVLRVYGREGQPCIVCEAKIRRRFQTGRSTYYCPRCQR